MFVEVYKYREEVDGLHLMKDEGYAMLFDEENTIEDASYWLGSLTEESVDEIEEYSDSLMVGIRYSIDEQWYVEAISKEEWRKEKEQ